MANNANKRVFYEWLNDNHGYFYTVNRTLQQTESEYQNVELVETDEMGNVLILDSITQVGQKVDWQYHEPMVHFPMLAHERPRRVLVIGGGDGGILREVLRHPSVESVDFVELDQKVVEFSRQHLPDINHGAFDDERVSVHFSDGRAFVEQADDGRWDVAIMDMTDPFGPSKMLYTKQFFQTVRDRLDPNNGLFTMHSESPVARPIAYQCIRRTLGSAFPVVRSAFAFVQMYATYWSFTIASNGPDIAAFDAYTIDERIRTRGLERLRMLNGDTWQAMQVPFPYISEIHRRSVPVITDEAPDFPDRFDH